MPTARAPALPISVCTNLITSGRVSHYSNGTLSVVGEEPACTNVPWIDDQGHQVRVLEMDLSHEPMLNGLAGSICRGRIRALFLAANTAQRASDPHELGSLALLQEWECGLEEIQWSQSIHLDMFLDDGRVDGCDRGEVIADARVGDDEVESVDTLALDLAHGIGRVGCRFAVNLHHQQFAGGIFGEGGELL